MFLAEDRALYKVMWKSTERVTRNEYLATFDPYQDMKSAALP